MARSEKVLAFRLIALPVIPFLNGIARLEMTGTEHLPKSGPFVLSPNHYSNIDPLIMAWAVWKLGRAPRFLAKASLFRLPVVGFALRRSGQIPVERAGTQRGSQPISAAEKLVEKEQGVIVYPEGTLTRDPDLWPMRGKTGAVRLALADGIPLIPMAHWGGQDILPRYGKLSFWPLRRRVKVIVGDPVDISEFRGKTAQPAALAAGTDRLMGAISQLLSQLRGEPAPEKRWNPAEHGQRETGRLEP